MYTLYSIPINVENKLEKKTERALFDDWINMKIVTKKNFPQNNGTHESNPFNSIRSFTLCKYVEHICNYNGCACECEAMP